MPCAWLYFIWLFFLELRYCVVRYFSVVLFPFSCTRCQDLSSLHPAPQYHLYSIPEETIHSKCTRSGETIVMCWDHLLRGWPSSLWLNLHDYEGDCTALIEKLAHYPGSKISSYTDHYPSRNFAGVLSESLAPLPLTTPTIVHPQSCP